MAEDIKKAYEPFAKEVYEKLFHNVSPALVAKAMFNEQNPQNPIPMTVNIKYHTPFGFKLNDKALELSSYALLKVEEIRESGNTVVVTLPLNLNNLIKMSKDEDIFWMDSLNNKKD